MSKLPFKIPPSLSSYVEQFKTEPDKSMEKLELHLKKRGQDAVGYFVLAWLQHKQGNDKQARENTLKAKCYAPGSLLFENMHYYMLHPKKFNAVVPRQKTPASQPLQSQDNANFDLNLESLIAKLSAASSLKVELAPDKPGEDKDLSIPAQMVNDLASETLAKIYEKQGKYRQAIESLKTLLKVKPDLADRFNKDIERLTKLSEEEKKTGTQDKR